MKKSKDVRPVGDDVKYAVPPKKPTKLLSVLNREDLAKMTGRPEARLKDAERMPPEASKAEETWFKAALKEMDLEKARKARIGNPEYDAVQRAYTAAEKVLTKHGYEISSYGAKKIRAKDDLAPVGVVHATDDSTVSPGGFLHAEDAGASRPVKHHIIAGRVYPAKHVAYDPASVQKEINKNKRIGGKEAKAIHSLLKGRAGDTDPVVAAQELMVQLNARLKMCKDATQQKAVSAKIKRLQAQLAVVGAPAYDASPFDRDTDKGAEKIVARERNNGLSAKQIAAKYGFDIKFVLEVGNKAKDLRPV